MMELRSQYQQNLVVTESNLSVSRLVLCRCHRKDDVTSTSSMTAKYAFATITMQADMLYHRGLRNREDCRSKF